MLITAATLNPTASICKPAPFISTLMAPLAALEPEWETETNVLRLYVQRKRQKKKTKNRGQEKRKKGENEADRAKGRNVVAVCQLLIRALVCPLWVRGRDWHWRRANYSAHKHTYVHTPLSVDVGFAVWEIKTDNRAAHGNHQQTWLSVAGRTLNSVQTRETDAELLLQKAKEKTK